MPIARRRTDSPTAHRASIESLETRALFTLTVQFDYTYDTNNFFDSPDKKAALQAAADAAVSRYSDTLAAIVPGNGNTWKAVIDHPATGGNIEVPNLTIPANTLIVFAGGRQMSSLGIGGPGGFTSSGTTDWNDLVAGRGQSNVRGTQARDFGPYGGTITFDTDPAGGWYFGLDETQIAGRSDFYSVALHEMTHLLGFGTADSWESRVAGALFTGPASIGEYDGNGNVPLSSDRAHWASGTNDGGKETAMDPDLTTGTRKLLTALDFAGMDDIGWDIPLAATLNSANSVTTAGATNTTFTVTYSHYTDIDTNTLGTGDLMVSGPGGFNAPASLESVSGTGKSLTVTYSIGAPGGTFDGADSGTYTVTMGSQTVGDGFGNFVPPGSLGSFTVNIDSPPSATLVANDVTQLGGADNALVITYADASGINASTIDVGDLLVTRNGDGLALAVTGVSVDTPGNGSPRVATYSVAAPGGSWDVTDNGTYTVSLIADQISDVNGTAAGAASLGTFDVSVGARNFSAAEKLTYTDASGDIVTVALKGPGSGQVLFDDPGNADASAIVLNDSTSATTLTITSAGAGTSMPMFTVNGALKAFTGKNVDLAGAMSISGTVPKLTLRNASGSIDLPDASGVATSITLASAENLSITSGSTLKLVKANAWLDGDVDADVITTPALSSLLVKGAAQVGVTAATIGKIVVGGELSGSEIRASGSIGAVTVGSATDSVIFAGVRADISTLPDSLDDFTNADAFIKSVALKGKSAPFSNTRIAAPSIGKASLGSAAIGTDPSQPFGLAADRVTSVSGITTTSGPYKLARLQDPGSGLDLIDFAIIVL